MSLDTRDPLLKAQDRAYWREQIAKAVAAERERCARLVETFSDDILVMVPRPGGPPGNFYRKSTKQDIADAIRNRNSEAK